MNEHKERYESVCSAFVQKKRDDGTEFYCFADNAPEELKDLFLEHYEVRDQDYEIMYDASSEIEDTELADIIKEDGNELFYEIESASVYNADRLSYLNIWNDDEISGIFKEYLCESISQACAMWYDRQVEEACNLLREYIIGSDNK